MLVVWSAIHLVLCTLHLAFYACSSWWAVSAFCVHSYRIDDILLHATWHWALNTWHCCIFPHHTWYKVGGSGRLQVCCLPWQARLQRAACYIPVVYKMHFLGPRRCCRHI